MNYLKLKNHLDKFLPIYVTVSMILGFLLGIHMNIEKYKGVLHWLNIAVVISMIYPMMINLRIGELKNSMKQGKQLTIGLIMGLVIAPLLMWIFIYIINIFYPLNPQLQLGLMLAMVVPCSSMSIAYTGFSEGNIELATIIVAFSFILAIITVPGWLAVYAASSHVSVPTMLLIITIIEVVFVPMFFGILTRSYLIKKEGAEGFLRLKPLFPAISLIGMYAIVFLIFMEKAKLIAKKPEMVLIALVPLILYYAFSLGLLTYMNRALGINYKDHMAITFPSVGKNEGTAMAIAMSAGMGLMAIPPAVTPLIQIPFLIGYVKMWRKIEKMWKRKNGY
ncbi:arsenite efflux pump ACR3-like permease [Aciduliprofundum sp. MAR08-339]|uniref:arsenic resistance protein n=1 Tax=Aciduliprofundum sp. (strain MAR08-339) TaxID=673860 RepID=UPI0002A4C6C4|nr:arsenite efflux pump ACR3-like permease [Aciduliprofundum sp. MAR08-339]